MDQDLTAIIVDDEAHCHTALSGLIARHHPDIRVLGVATTIAEALDVISVQSPNILFLEVEIGDHTGFEIWQALGPKHSHVIFTTAHEGYALKAIRFSALDFLLKPIDVDDLAVALTKLRASLKQAPDPIRILSLLNNLHRLKAGRLSVPTQWGVKEIAVASILCINYDGDKAWLHSDGQEPMPLQVNLKDCEHLLAEYGFIRAQRTTLINPCQVHRIKGGLVVLNNGMRFAVDPNKR